MKHGDWSVNSFVTLGDIETGTVFVAMLRKLMITRNYCLFCRDAVFSFFGFKIPVG